jgi:predicted membrane-bound spermidine synthase
MPITVALYAIFFVSGFCGLIYESIWSHYLKLLLGHAAYAQAVVLVVFIGGLAIGAWFTGRWSERIKRPLLAYALVEAAVGVIAFTFQRIFESASVWASYEFLPAMCDGAGACAASWLVAAALIFIPSVLLGTTFPLMSAAVIRLGVQPGRGLSLLYFLNSSGAALGVLGAGFVLMPAFGLPGTMIIAGAMNVFVALAAYLASQHPACKASAVAGVAPRADGTQSGRRLRILLLVAGITGLSSFIYEVAWIRLLTLVLGSATHSFELMLAPFILGLALGAWWIRDRIDASTDTWRLLAVIQILMGVLAVATLPMYVACYDIMAYALRALARNGDSYALFNLASLSLAAAVMLPAAICAGMTLPLITATLLREGYGERQVGQVYGVNTFGAIAGVLVTVHVLIPAMGLQLALVTGAAIDVALGLLLWALALRRTTNQAGQAGRWAWVAAAGAASVAWLVAVPALAPLETQQLASGVYRHGGARVPENEARVVYYRDGKTASLSVLERPNGDRGLLTNGKSDGSSHPSLAGRTADDNTMVLVAALGPLHHPKAKTAAVIGLGTGSSTAVLLQAPGITQVDTIEIEPLMVDAAQLFRPRNAAAFDDPRSRIIIDDARAHFSKTRANYDLVVSEPSNPWVSGVAGLFTMEFYQHVSAHLAPDGHFVQWLHLYEASPELVASILRAFAHVFPEFKAYATNSVDVVLVARNDGKEPSIAPGTLEAMPQLRARLAELGITDLAMLAAHETGRTNALKVLANSYGAPPNSDYFPYVDHRAGRDRFEKQTATTLFSLREAPVPILEFANGAPPEAGQIRSAGPFMPAHVRNRASGWHGHRYLSGETLTVREIAYFGSYTQDYALVRSWLRGCSFPTDAGLHWPAMVRVATDLNPGLDGPTAEGFWKAVLAGCRRSLGPAQVAWMELFSAVGARKPAEIHVHAERVLALDTALSAETRAYAALAAIAANIAVGRRPEAADVFVTQRAKLPAAQVETAWFRYLAEALSTKERPTPTSQPVAPAARP